MFLPFDWWKLSLLWFANLKSRTPPLKRGLFKNSLRVSALSLALGVGGLSVTLAIVTGFEWAFAKSVAHAQGDAIHIFYKWMAFKDLEKLVSKAPPGVVSAEYYWSSQGLLVGPKGGRGVLVEGRRASGTTLSDGHAGLVHMNLGKPLAEYLGVSRGDQIRLLLPGILKGPVLAEVDNLISNGMYEIDSRLAQVDDASLRAYIREKDPEAFHRRPGDAHGIRFFLNPSISRPDHMAKLQSWLSAYKKTALDFEPKESVQHFSTWRDQKASIFKGIGYNKMELTLVVSLLTLVAALNVAATLVVLFLERDQEIAILQALGMSPFQVLQWILIQGFLLGLASSFLGMAFGRLFGWALVKLPIAQLPSDIYNIATLPLKFESFEQLRVFAFGILSAVLAALLLGLRLSRIQLVSLLGRRA